MSCRIVEVSGEEKLEEEHNHSLSLIWIAVMRNREWTYSVSSRERITLNDLKLREATFAIIQ